jgi:hypothetical protein
VTLKSSNPFRVYERSYAAAVREAEKFETTFSVQTLLTLTLPILTLINHRLVITKSEIAMGSVACTENAFYHVIPLHEVSSMGKVLYEELWYEER